MRLGIRLSPGRWPTVLVKGIKIFNTDTKEEIAYIESIEASVPEIVEFFKSGIAQELKRAIGKP